MLGLRKTFEDGGDLASVIEGLREGLREQLVAGLSNSARTLFMASVYAKADRPLFIVTHNLYQAQKIYDDLTEFLDEEDVFLYPVNELISSEIAAASPELKAQRLDVLNQLCEDSKKILVAPIAGLRRMLPPKTLWKQSRVSVYAGKELNVKQLLDTFVAGGYERTPMVGSPGEFSVRGGIIDVYPLTEEKPVRIELFDTEIDSIRYFDVESQRSEEKAEQLTIGPAEEVLLFDDHYNKGAKRLEQKLSEVLSRTRKKAVKEKLSENVPHEIEQLAEHQVPEGVYKYMSLFYDEPSSLLDYIGERAVVLLDEVTRIKETAEHLEKEEVEWRTALAEEGEMPVNIEVAHETERLIEGRQVLYFSLFLRHIPHTHPENIVNVTCRAMQNFHGQMPVLQNEMKRWQSAGYAVVFLAVNRERARRLGNVLSDYGIEADFMDGREVVTGKAQIAVAALQGGFELPMQKTAVVTEQEVFTKKAKKSRKRQKLSNAERIKNYSELNVGDYVVHVNHGIGKYLGIETLEVNGVHKDYLHLRYAGDDKLYIPVEQIDQVQKYIASEEKEPKVYKLGGNDWKRVKNRVQSSVQDIADDLIQLYAEREASKGFAFEKDGEAQREFEAAFPYQETEDQLKAIEEVKRDMEQPRPMDRLLCGDVGYGKTEVAIRAAFKAIMNGKQVAFLVPTTILAQQHFETVSERFADYPVNIGLLSRFRTKKQQNETLKGLKGGTVDFVIGTHRLLSKDVNFNDLGLLVIDEEQRFGVTHKEKIKKLKSNVDVLTLTATPIPRTLHMSMLGVRDLSVIETPPENRFPVQTYVAEYSGMLVREAIERELARGGQVYFLYNRVEHIQRMAEHVSSLVPDARVAFAHGQMKESELEAVMFDFLDGDYDVLVSTTIIETGVDIPNVNTLIVYDGDKMGLSQLYQLRGRVGRSNRVAYAYLTYQRDKVLNEVSEKRLQAIKEFTELGSGFKIAMRDLSIRGTGNLLGSEQHGFIDSVGFDLYSQMLQDAIARRKGEKPKLDRPGVDLDIEADAYIPDSYIGDSRQKIEMYKRFKGADSLQDIFDLEEEIIDRFGDFPEEVTRLFAVSRIKVLAEELGIESVKQDKTAFAVLFREGVSESMDRAGLVEAVGRMRDTVNLGTQGNKIKLVVSGKELPMTAQLERLRETLSALSESQKQTA
ncbi:MAG TPA: transcription-repair coupling factor [Bacillales bacterium]|nr:transcription-repair coupling factor [Bacillales bacterium]